MVEDPSQNYEDEENIMNIWNLYQIATFRVSFLCYFCWFSENQRSIFKLANYWNDIRKTCRFKLNFIKMVKTKKLSYDPSQWREIIVFASYNQENLIWENDKIYNIMMQSRKHFTSFSQNCLFVMLLKLSVLKWRENQVMHKHLKLCHTLVSQ